MKRILVALFCVAAVVACEEEDPYQPGFTGSFASGHVRFSRGDPAPDILVELLESYWDGGLPPGETYRTVLFTRTSANGYFSFDFEYDDFSDYYIRASNGGDIETVDLQPGVTKYLVLELE